MDLEEARRILFTRVQSFDAENAFKIMGYVLLQDWGEQGMLRLALGSDVVLHSLLTKAKIELGLTTRNTSQLPTGNNSVNISQELSISIPGQSLAQASPFVPSLDTKESLYMTEQANPNSSCDTTFSPMFLPQLGKHFTLPRTTSLPARHELSQDSLSLDRNQNSNSAGFSEWLEQQYLHSVGLASNTRDPNFLSPAFNGWPSPSSADTVSTNMNSSSAWKPCLYFARGYCKHGSNCRFLHSAAWDSLFHSPGADESSESLEDEILKPKSLDCLEKELRELLGGRRTPVSIASLPQLYYEKFGKTLQAEGYLTESQRHGKAGFSLTKLLARLKNTITLIDRPHGQHAVVLTEDAPKFADLRGIRDDSFTSNSSSRQIYLTFPAESTFTEEDVTIHFRAYGPVQDVRIPYQQRRMFGFVTFTYAETVKIILAEGNPHYICGARVLVKPYKEKAKLGDRRVVDRGDPLRYMTGFSQGRYELDHFQFPRFHEPQQVFKQMEVERILALERRIGELQLVDSQKHFSEATTTTLMQQQKDNASTQPFHVDDVPLSAEDCFNIQSNTFGYVLDVLEGDSKENDSSEDAVETITSNLDVKASNDSSVVSTVISSTPDKSSTVDMIKSHHLNSQNFPLTQYNWSAPTLFARSVF